jgi:hypothetical protein
MVSKQISLSEQVNALDDLAALLYTWALLHTDDYGVVRASPVRLRAEVAPLRDCTVAQMEAAITAWIDAGLVVWYECEGEPYILFPTFEQHQQGLHKRSRSRALPHPEYDGTCGNFRCSPALSGKFREVPGSSRPRELKRSEENNNPSAQADDACAPVEPEKPKAKRTRKARPPEEVQADIDTTRNGLNPAYLPHIDAYLDLCASHNDTGQIAKTRELTETTALVTLIRECELSPPAFAHGVRAAIGAPGRNGKPGAANINYVKSAALGYTPGADFTGGRGAQGGQRRLSIEDEAILRDEQRARDRRAAEKAARDQEGEQ